MRSLSLMVVLASGLGLAVDASAEDPIRKIDPSKPVGAIVTEDAKPQGAAVISPQENDRRIVRWLAVDNRGIAECADFAVDHASNDAVKQLASDIAKQHEDFVTHFGRNVENNTAPNGQAAATAEPNKTATLLRDDGASRAGAMIYRPTDFVAVKEEVCKQLADLGKKQMESLEGAHFDRAFLAHMKFGHHALIASVDVLDDTASADLQPQLKQLRDMLEQHLARVEELEKGLNVDTTAARPDGAEVK